MRWTLFALIATFSNNIFAGDDYRKLTTINFFKTLEVAVSSSKNNRAVIAPGFQLEMSVKDIERINKLDNGIECKLISNLNNMHWQNDENDADKLNVLFPLDSKGMMICRIKKGG